MTNDPYKSPGTEELVSGEVADLKMFSQLANFGFKRTAKQAFGFYISYLLLGLVLGFVVGGIAGLLDPDNSQQAGLLAGQIMVIPYVMTLAILVAVKRSLLKSFTVIFLLALTALLSLALGALGGLIPVSFLTTREEKSHNKSSNPDAASSAGS